jgi:hypothetical protein
MKPSDKARHSVRRVVQVLDAHNEKGATRSKLQLEALAKLDNIEAFGLIVKARENCVNSWLSNDILALGGKLRFVFLVYGPSPLLYHESIISGGTSASKVPVFHWPLGVATYRNFPKVKTSSLSVAEPKKQHRKYLCNFLGTVYANAGDRAHVVSVLKSHLDNVNNTSWISHLKARNHWTPSETKETLNEYIFALNNSDYTLCPSGKNPEAYRIYEAMSYGSVPVLQRNAQASADGIQGPDFICKDSYALFKEMNAPVIWVEDWEELESLMDNLSAESPEITYQRRYHPCFSLLINFLRMTQCCLSLII